MLPIKCSNNQQKNAFRESKKNLLTEALPTSSNIPFSSASKFPNNAKFFTLGGVSVPEAAYPRLRSRWNDPRRSALTPAENDKPLPFFNGQDIDSSNKVKVCSTSRIGSVLLPDLFQSFHANNKGVNELARREESFAFKELTHTCKLGL